MNPQDFVHQTGFAISILHPWRLYTVPFLTCDHSVFPPRGWGRPWFLYSRFSGVAISVGGH